MDQFQHSFEDIKLANKMISIMGIFMSKMHPSQLN